MDKETQEEKLEEMREERRRQTRGWQQLVGLHTGGMYMTKDGEIREQIYRVLEKYHYNSGGKAFCGVSLHIAKEVPGKVLRQQKYLRCRKCLAALRRALI